MRERLFHSVRSALCKLLPLSYECEFLYLYVHILKTATKTIFQKFKGKKSFITLRFVCQMDYLTFYLPLLISTALDVS